ncbi:MAG: hypothetical protein GF384_00070 [Elusimicrobia bacterium]|nr:hypothetical protein [Elusimicrobiota bacterium]MBD3411492.1 hypothetical protein [Elusimicrobiota bacterium]
MHGTGYRKNERLLRRNETVNNALSMLLLFFTGIMLGVLYFGGLWLTIQLVASGGNRMRIAAVSYVLRLTVVGLCLFFILKTGLWLLIIPCLIGFVTSRMIMIRTVKRNYL